MLHVHNFSAGYYKNVSTLQDISFAVPKGHFCAILGANGSGKTTLIRGLMGLLPYTSGDIILDNQNIETYSKLGLAQKVSVLSQEQPVNMDFTAEDIVRLGRYPFSRKELFSGSTTHDMEVVDNSFQVTNSSHLRNRIYSSLSGGERQRVLLAKAFAQEPKLLFLDEPTNHLDIKHTLELLNLLKLQQVEMGLTVVAILHDLNLASLFSDQLIFMKQGRVFAKGGIELLANNEVLEEVFEVNLRVMRHPETGKPQITYS